MTDAEVTVELLYDRASRLRETLQTIVDCHEARSELYPSDEQCAATLADFARLALKEDDER